MLRCLRYFQSHEDKRWRLRVKRFGTRAVLHKFTINGLETTFFIQSLKVTRERWTEVYTRSSNRLLWLLSVELAEPK